MPNNLDDLLIGVFLSISIAFIILWGIAILKWRKRFLNVIIPCAAKPKTKTISKQYYKNKQSSSVPPQIAIISNFAKTDENNNNNNSTNENGGRNLRNVPDYLQQHPSSVRMKMKEFNNEYRDQVNREDEDDEEEVEIVLDRRHYEGDINMTGEFNSTSKTDFDNPGFIDNDLDLNSLATNKQVPTDENDDFITNNNNNNNLKTTTRTIISSTPNMNVRRLEPNYFYSNANALLEEREEPIEQHFDNIDVEYARSSRIRPPNDYPAEQFNKKSYYYMDNLNEMRPPSIRPGYFMNEVRLWTISSF